MKETEVNDWGPDPCWGCGSVGDHPTLGGHYWPCGTMKSACIRGEQCYENEIANLKKVARDAVVVLNRANDLLKTIWGTRPDAWTGALVAELRSTGDSIEAIMPRLEAAAGEKVVEEKP